MDRGTTVAAAAAVLPFDPYGYDHVSTIRFIAPGFIRTVQVAAERAHSRTLLAIAQDHGIPILFNCEAGGCGACIVHVEAASPDGCRAPLTDDEAFLLAAMGKLAEGLEDDDASGPGPRFRLACQYVLTGEDDIVVDFTNELGGA
jgi:ferredoxin